LVIFLAQGTWDIYKKAKSIDLIEGQAKEQLKNIKDRHGFVKEEIARLQTDQGLGYEIRSKFNVSKNNEKVIIIVDEETTNSVSEKKSDNF
jgi:cell division protein FtsB